MPCARALNPADNYHPPFEKADGYAARFSVIATRIGESEGFAFEHPAGIEKIQPSPAQACRALRGVRGDFHRRIVYTKSVGVTGFFGPRPDEVIQ